MIDGQLKEFDSYLGASSPAKPALHIPDPLSTTKAAISSSHILIDFDSSPSKQQESSTNAREFHSSPNVNTDAYGAPI